MQVQISGKQIDIGDALRTHVGSRLSELVGKYFDDAIDGSVVFSRQGSFFRADCSVHVGGGISVQAQSEAADIYAGFDAAADRIDKQLRRYKRRLRKHHLSRRSTLTDEALAAQAYVLAPEPEDEGEEEPADFAPLVVAETTTEIATLTVGEAVMRMDLASQPALMFRNRGRGGLNVVYRRPDGNIGWSEPRHPG